MKNPKIKEFERQITILWASLLIGATMITIIFTMMLKDYPEFYSCENFSEGPFSFLTLAVAAFGVFMSSFLYIRQMSKSSALNGLDEKLEHYRTAIVQRSALVEGPTLLAAVFMYLDRCYWFLGIIVILLLVQLAYRPSIAKFRNDCTLTMSEKQELSGF